MTTRETLQPGQALRRLILRMRPEEAIAVAFIVPTTWLTLVAHYFAPESGSIGPRFIGGVFRITVAALCGVIIFLAAKLKPERGTILYSVREMLPFLVCVLIYTNLHDTIGFVNPHNISPQLAAIDRWIFGVEPVLWAEQFYSRFRTELFQTLYMSFIVIAPAVPLALLFQERFEEFRRSSLAIMVCFYLGYVIYLVLPAAPPRIALVSEFRRNFGGDPFIASLAAERAFALLPTDSRAAFPSLHAAISLLALILAWRHVRRLFFLLLPIAVGLWVSTVYLRHHFVIDLLAGFALAPLADRLAPRLDAWWSSKRTLFLIDRRAEKKNGPEMSSGPLTNDARNESAVA